ncbi:hypothetical protein [Streptomyces sp. JJ38]|uniref:hypothetical protein n=1 Tax=Streptomyces sp. JJ38 TaxID=2738128 RepID=UPI001C58DB3B|nr:hypothetical protein [Streptomyces sp. JJ38]MBW1597891.1 hypothetical protein [Streptomyces sp. JJ38]
MGETKTAGAEPVLRCGGVTVRLSEDGIEWEDRKAVSRIPYEAVVSVSAHATVGRYARLRLGLHHTGTGHPDHYELLCLRRSGQPFAEELNERVSGAGGGWGLGRRPRVTVEPRSAALTLRTARAALRKRCAVR